jgi:hypothetical protein
VFTTFRGQPVTTRQDLVRVIGNLNEGSVPVQVRRGERVRDFAVEVPRFEARSERRTAMRPNYDSGQTFERQFNSSQYNANQYDSRGAIENRQNRVENRIEDRQNRADERQYNRNEGRGMGILPRNR